MLGWTRLIRINSGSSGDSEGVLGSDFSLWASFSSSL